MQRVQKLSIVLGFLLFEDHCIASASKDLLISDSNGGVQWSDGKSLGQTKLATLHFGGRVKMS